MSWRGLANGAKCDNMAARAQALRDAKAPSSYVAEVRSFQPQEATDYVNEPANLSACSLLELKGKQEALLGDAAEHLYQLNHAHTPPPSKTDSIVTNIDGRLFTQLDCWDNSKKITLAFRSKATQQLAQIPEGKYEEYKDAHINGELRHPLLASARVHVKKKDNAQSTQGADAEEHSQTAKDSALLAIVVEAEPCAFAEVPNDSVDAIHGLLAAALPLPSERPAASSLEKP
jgi:hypothetical protein